MLSLLIFRSVAKGSGATAAGPLFMNGLLLPAVGCEETKGDCAGAAADCIGMGCIGMGCIGRAGITLSSGMAGGCACILGSEAVGRAAWA